MSHSHSFPVARETVVTSPVNQLRAGSFQHQKQWINGRFYSLPRCPETRGGGRGGADGREGGRTGGRRLAIQSRPRWVMGACYVLFAGLTTRLAPSPSPLSPSLSHMSVTKISYSEYGLYHLQTQNCRTHTLNGIELDIAKIVIAIDVLFFCRSCVSETGYPMCWEGISW